MGKTADLTVVQKTIIDTLHKEGKTQTFITKEAVHRVLYPSMLTESWVEGKSVEEKMHNQPREPQPYEDCQEKSIQEFGWTSQGMDWGWGQGIKEFSLAISSLYSVSHDPSEIIIICRFIIDGKKTTT